MADARNLMSPTAWQSLQKRPELRLGTHYFAMLSQKNCAGHCLPQNMMHASHRVEGLLFITSIEFTRLKVMVKIWPSIWARSIDVINPMRYVLRRCERMSTSKELPMNPTSKLCILTHRRILRQKKLAEASIVCNLESLEAGPEGDNDIWAVVIVTISISCRIILTPVVRN